MLETEEMLKGRESRMSLLEDLPHDLVSESIVFGAAQIAKRLQAEIVFIASSTGGTARLKSKQRDYIKTVCFTDDDQVLKRMCLYWGIIPILLPKDATSSLRDYVGQWAKQNSDAKSGDPVVIVSDTEWMPGVHDAIMVCRLPE